MVIGDLQVKPGLNTDHIRHCGQLAADKQPEVIVQIGDWNDNLSLSSYDRGKAAAENRRHTADYAAFTASVDLFMETLSRAKGYKPRLVFTRGNHCEREDRYEFDHPELTGTIPKSHEYLQKQGWECYPYLKPVTIDGVSYCHIHPRTMGGKVTTSSLRFGAPDAKTMVRANMCSVTAGHSPGVQYHVQAVGSRLYHGLILGSTYKHNESFMSPVGNSYWRGCVMKNRVRNGQYDPCFISLGYLKEKYGG